MHFMVFSGSSKEITPCIRAKAKFCCAKLNSGVKFDKLCALHNSGMHGSDSNVGPWTTYCK